MNKGNKYIDNFLSSLINNTDVFEYVLSENKEDYISYVFHWKYGYRYGKANIMLGDNLSIGRYSYIEIKDMDAMLFISDYPLLYDLFTLLLDKQKIEYQK